MRKRPKRPQTAAAKSPDKPKWSVFVWREHRAELAAQNQELEDRIAKLGAETTPGGPTENGDGHDELGALVETWRAAAQQAAGELYETSKMRVQRCV